MAPEQNAMLFIVEKGGPMMFAIMGASLVLITIVVERFISLKKLWVDPDWLIGRIAQMLKEGERISVVEFLKRTPGVLPRILEAAMLRADLERDDIQMAIDNAIQKHMPILERFITPLGTIATIAPFLGLLGTIMGMINSFAKIASAGTTGASVIATGVYEALYATAAGLAVAIPAVIFYNYYRSRIQLMVSEMEIAGSRLIEIIILKREGKPFPEDLVA